jgi:hypothetical protein
MFITKKHISRRTLLRGAGTALALPLLDAMIPAFTAESKTAAKAPPRFFGGFVPHGAAPGYWIPEQVGALPEQLPFIWKPMEPYRQHLNILTGLHSRSAEPPPGETGADHWVAAAFLCAEKPRKTAGADVYAGQTIDQIIAAKYGQDTLLPSVEISVEDPGSGSSNCGEGYSCVYTNTIAWGSPVRPLPMELNPQVVFERMFGSGSTAGQRALRRERNQSILDSVNDKIKGVRNEVSAPDRVRLDAFTENVREIERRLQIAASATAAAPEDFAVPPGIPQSFDQQDHVRPAGAGLPGGHHPCRHHAVRARSHRPHLSRKRHANGGIPRALASWRGPEPDRPAVEDQPVPREDAGLLRRQAGQYQ